MSTAALVDEIARLRAENTELRLTLAAEQGKAEGAPSDGWTYRERGADGWGADRWEVSTATRVTAMVRRLHDCTWELWFDRKDGPLNFQIHATARAAMLAADKALFESRRTRCLAKARQLQTDGVILYPPNGTHQQTPTIMIDRLSDPALTEAALAIYEKALFP